MAKLKQQAKKFVRKAVNHQRAQRNPAPAYGDHEDMLTGLTDPFSGEAANARYPDSGAGRTLTFQQRFSITITTDAQGEAAFAVNPRVNYPYLYYASMAGNVATWPATWYGDASLNLVNTYGRFYRPTSYGVRLVNTLSATNAAGYIVIAKGGIPVLSSTTTFNPTNFTAWDVHPMTHGGEWHTVGTPASSNAYDMKDLTATAVDTTNADEAWNTTYFAVQGSAASLAVLIAEIYVNYEYTSREDAPIAQLASPQPTLNIQMQTAVNHVQSAHPTSHKGAKSVVTGFIKKEGKKALLKHVLPFVAKKAALALL